MVKDLASDRGGGDHQAESECQDSHEHRASNLANGNPGSPPATPMASSRPTVKRYRAMSNLRVDPGARFDARDRSYCRSDVRPRRIPRPVWGGDRLRRYLLVRLVIAA